jgi:TIR domain
MRVFISWSGEPSRSIAKALHDWLQGVVQRVEPWMSDDDIDGGARWNDALAKALEETDFGIVCVTRANQAAPWLNFEAGAVAKKVGTAKVVPLLIDLPSTDLEGPLTAFQWRLLDEKDIRRLLHDLNKAAEEQVPEKALDRLFDATWEELKDGIDEAVVGAGIAQAKPERLVEDMLVEVVETVRRMDRRMETDLRSAIERFLRLDEFSTPLDRPYVVTTGQPMNLNRGVFVTNEMRSKEEVLRREIDDEITRSSSDEDQQP